MQFAFIKKQRTLFKFLIVIILLSLVTLQQYLKKPLVSVVMPTYNRAELLPRAIESILNQTMKDFEFIIVDDGSTDNTPQLLQTYQLKDPRIKVITLHQNKGVATARNVGNQAAKGKYITVMDSDDIALPLLLQKTSEYLDTHPHITLVRPAGKNYQNGVDPYLQNYDFYFPMHEIIFRSGLGNVGATYRNDFVKKNKISYNPSYHCAEDWDFWIKIIKAGGTMRDLEDKEPLYIVRVHYTTPYTDCESNSHLISKNFKHFLALLPEEQNNKCFVFKKTLQFNPSLFNKETIEAALRAYCPPQSQFYIKVSHPDWTDYFIFSKDKTRISRYEYPEEKASVLSFISQKEITVKWDTWGTETFKYISEDIYQLENSFIRP